MRLACGVHIAGRSVGLEPTQLASVPEPTGRASSRALATEHPPADVISSSGTKPAVLLDDARSMRVPIEQGQEGTAMTRLRPATFRDWSLSYGKAKKAPAYDEAEARRRFDAGDTLHVLFGDEHSPEIVLRVELGGRLVEVVWLDGLNRPELSYVFHQPEDWPDDELFLSQTRLTTYDHDVPLPEGDPSSNEVWFFKPDGSLHGARRAGDGPTERTDGVLDADQLLLHRERRPAFGEWNSLIRQER